MATWARGVAARRFLCTHVELLSNSRLVFNGHAFICTHSTPMFEKADFLRDPNSKKILILMDRDTLEHFADL